VRTLSSVLVSNVLSEEQKQQVIALGRLGWSLRRIQRETGVRRETISTYLKEEGLHCDRPAVAGSGQNRPYMRAPAPVNRFFLPFFFCSRPSYEHTTT